MKKGVAKAKEEEEQQQQVVFSKRGAFATYLLDKFTKDSRAGKFVTSYYGGDLCEAARMGDFHAVSIFIKRNADPNITVTTSAIMSSAVETKETPLFYAIRGSMAVSKDEEAQYKTESPIHMKTIQFLVENGAKVETRNKLRQTPLMIACHVGNFSVVKYLLGQGAKPNKFDLGGNSSLHWACYGGLGNDHFRTPPSMDLVTTQTMLKLLIHYGATVNPPERQNWSIKDPPILEIVSEVSELKEVLQSAAKLQKKGIAVQYPPEELELPPESERRRREKEAKKESQGAPRFPFLSSGQGKPLDKRRTDLATSSPETEGPGTSTASGSPKKLRASSPSKVRFADDPPFPEETKVRTPPKHKGNSSPPRNNQNANNNSSRGLLQSASSGTSLLSLPKKNPKKKKPAAGQSWAEEEDPVLRLGTRPLSWMKNGTMAWRATTAEGGGASANADVWTEAQSIMKDIRERQQRHLDARKGHAVAREAETALF